MEESWLLVLATGATALLAAAFTLGLFLLLHVHRRTPRLDPGLPPGRLPLVSILVPARNEEANIGACVAGCRHQSYPNLEVLVVDDGSTDRTSEIVLRHTAADPRVRLIRGEALPSGWKGKNFALHQAARQARGEAFLFVDADVLLDPDAVLAAMGLLERTQAALLTVFPHLVAGSFWERVVQPVIGLLVLVAFPADQVNDPDNPKASGNGPFLLFDAQAYRAIGGHEAVRADPVEDLALATRIKSSGRRLVYALGTRLVSVRMYGSLREIVRGWSKNFYLGLGGKALPALGAALGLLVAGLGPYLALLAGALLPSPGLAALGLYSVLVLLAQRRLLRQLYRLDSSLGWLQPLAYVVVLGILARSALGPAPSWKGRSLQAS